MRRGASNDVKTVPRFPGLIVETLYALVPVRRLVLRFAPRSVVRRLFPLVLLRGYKDFNRGGIVPHANFLEDFQLYQAAEVLGTVGTFHGRGALEQVIAELLEAFEEVSFAPESMRRVDDNRLVIIVRFVARGRHSGVRVDRPIAHVWTRRGGRVAGLDVYWTPNEAFEAVGLVE